MVKGMIAISFQENRSLPRTRLSLQHIRAWAYTVLQLWRLCLSSAFLYFCLGAKGLIDLLCFSDELSPTILWPSFLSWTLFLHHPTLGFSSAYLTLKEHCFSLALSVISGEKEAGVGGWPQCQAVVNYREQACVSEKGPGRKALGS